MVGTKKQNRKQEVTSAKQCRTTPPSRYTCAVAKEKRVVDFINEKNSLSLKMSALKGLCLMNQESKWSIKCLVCGERLWANKEVSYDWQSSISMNNNHNIYTVHKLRRHYEKAHPQTPVWNAVPESKFNRESKSQPLDYFIHQAMRAGGSKGYIPEDQSCIQYCIAFTTRIFSAMNWIQWNPMVSKRLQQLGGNKSMCSAANDVLNKVLEVGLERIKSKQFLKWAESTTPEQLFNILMLFFFEMDRYKSCEVFGQPQEQEAHNGTTTPATEPLPTTYPTST